MNILIGFGVGLFLLFGLLLLVANVDISAITSSVPGVSAFLGIIDALLLLVGVGVILIVFIHKAKGE